MNTNTTTVVPGVIALDFYDGATEGFVELSVKDYGKYYFKLLAWDNGQDKRLFIVSRVDETTYERVVELLTRSQELPSSPVWIPKWEFRDDKDKEEADSLIDSCQKNLSSSELLMLGEGINKDSTKVIEMDAQSKLEANKILKQGKPDDLANWLPKLNIK